MQPDEIARLVRAAAAGHGDAWRALVDRYTGLVWSVARSFRLDRSDAEDVAQTTWEKCARAIMDLREPERIGAWLATTARREALRVYEVRKRTAPGGDLVWIGAHGVDDRSPERLVVDRQEAADRAAYGRRAWRELGRLSAGCQQLLRILLATPPPTYAEAAAALDRPIGYIGPSRRRCLDRLRTLMDAPVSLEGQPPHD